MFPRLFIITNAITCFFIPQRDTNVHFNFCTQMYESLGTSETSLQGFFTISSRGVKGEPSYSIEDLQWTV